MIKADFLNAMRSFLATELAATPANFGSAEPTSTADLPAVTMSLERVQRLGSGLGERTTTITHGALPCTASINLANPFLPEDPTFPLLNASRLQLILPHGGLVGADAVSHPLGPTDLSSPSPAPHAPSSMPHRPADQVRSNPQVGLLTFQGAPLPATGTVVARYFVGQWEQRIGRVAGALRLVVRADSTAATQTLSERILDAWNVAAPAPSQAFNASRSQNWAPSENPMPNWATHVPPAPRRI